ncbi:MAG: lipase family protein [Nitrospiria bacterium]
MSTEFDFTHDTTQFSLNNAYCLAKASELAYEKKEKIEETVRQWGFRQFRFYEKNGTQGFTMSNEQIIVTAFRGTEMKIEDWMTDLNFDLVPGPMDGQVHEGFYDAIREVWDPVQRTLARFRENKPKSLWFTGHSLGAALAALAVALLRDEDHPVDGLYTFGQPRLGDRIFARNFNLDFKPYAFRFVNNNDIVTRMAPRLMKYSHIGTFKYFTEPGKLVDDIGWWNRFLDRMRGRIEDILEWGTDGMKDHGMAGYTKLIKNVM